MTNRVNILLIFCLSGYFTVPAQIKIDTLKGMFRSVYLPAKDSILRTYTDGYGLSSPDDPLNEKRFRIKNWSEVNLYSYFFVTKNMELLMIDWVAGTIARIRGDQIDSAGGPGYQKMFIETTLFQGESDVYMYGGYGFWSARNRLMKVSNDYRWEPVLLNSASNSSEKKYPPGLFDNQVMLIDQEAFLFNGRIINPEDPLEKPHFDEVWTFDFEKRSWQKRGRVNPELFPGTPQARVLIPLDDRAYILRDEKVVVELFPKKNKAVIYNHSLISIEVLRAELWRLAPFYRNGKIYFYRNLHPASTRTFDKMEFELKSVSVPEFLGQKTGEEIFYAEDWRLLKDWRLWSAVLMLVGFLTYRLSGGIKTGPRLELTETGLRYRSKDYEVPDVHLSVLKKLYEAGGPVSSAEILRLVENPGLQYSHNNRIKNEVINRLNIQLQSILNTKEELIKLTSSDADKRYKWYELRREWF
jgi:hypothetical protein